MEEVGVEIDEGKCKEKEGIVGKKDKKKKGKRKEWTNGEMREKEKSKRIGGKVKG